MRVLIDTLGTGVVDYTRYVVDGTLSVEDSINVPTLLNFTLAATDNSFIVPKRSSYVRVVSDVYASGAGYGTGKVLATGFITNEPERQYLGLNPILTEFSQQQLAYLVNVSSDEWLLNCNPVPYIPAFVNQTMGQILGGIADALMPGFFDVTSHVMSGDIVPYYQYDSSKTWADIAKDFGDSIRYRYKVRDRVLYFEPFENTALGVSYDESDSSEVYPSQLTSNVVTVPPINDSIVIGAIEPQTNWENYFIGDGFSSQFKLLHNVFDGSTALLLEDDWTESSFQTNLWNVQDPFNVFSLTSNGQALGALNVNQLGQAGSLNETYILGLNGVELGGGLALIHGEFEFVDICEGIVGGLYSNRTLTQDNCIAGFSLTSPGTIVPTASGASGIVMQPIYNGQLVGPQVVSQVNHQYTLQTWFGVSKWDRYERIYKNLNGDISYGGNQLAASGAVTWAITDVDLGLYANVSPAQVVALQILPSSNPVTQFTLQNQDLPEFGIYAPINSENLNLTLQYTSVAQPPEGSLFVRSLTGASGLQLPVKPDALGDEYHYLMGFGLENQTATVLTNGDSQYLAFYSNTIPGVGARIRYQSWAAAQSVSRVRDTIAVTNEAQVSGDTGVRSAILTNMSPLPRTSAECELAAAASILDNEYPQFQGTYTFESVPRKFTEIFDPGTDDYPSAGKNFYINSTVRAISGQQFTINTARIQVEELREEVLQISLDYGPDLYLEKLLTSFEQRSDNLLLPQSTAPPIDYVHLDEVGNAYLSMLDQAKVTNIVNSLTGNYVSIDLGVVPVTGCEVRRADFGWGVNDNNRVGLFTTQSFDLPRTSRDQTWYLRQLNGPLFSRFSKALRVNYPVIPAPPTLLAANESALVFDLNGDVRDIYGFELRVNPISGASVNLPINYQPPDDPIDNMNSLSRVSLLSQAPSGFHFVGSVVLYFWPSTAGSNGSWATNYPRNVSTASASATGNSIMFNPQVLTGVEDPLVEPMQWATLNTDGTISGYTTPWSGATENYDMAIVTSVEISVTGNYNFTFYHDDGMFFAIDGARMLTGPVNDPWGHGKTAIAGYAFSNAARPVPPYAPGNGGVAGVNQSGYHRAITYLISFPTVGIYPIEIDYSQWQTEQTMLMFAGTPPITIANRITTLAGSVTPPPVNVIASYAPAGSVSPFPYPTEFQIGDVILVNCPADASFNGLRVVGYSIGPPDNPWEIGWCEFGNSFPTQVGGTTSNSAATVQLYYRNAYVAVTGMSYDVGTGVATIGTSGAVPFSAGDSIAIGASFTSFPAGAPETGDAAFVTGLFAISSTGTNQFTIQIDSAIQTQLLQQGYVTGSYGLQGYAASLPPQETENVPLSALAGVLVQKPVFAPSDLAIDITNPDIQQKIALLEAASPGSVITGLAAYFFNLTWDYSAPTSIPNLIVPSIGNLSVDVNSQSLTWSIVTGRPTGYRVDVSDPLTRQTYNSFTVDNPQNPQVLTRFQMTNQDFFSNRTVTVTPFNALGDGLPSVLDHAAVTPGIGIGNNASYTIGCTWDGILTDGVVLVRVPLDQAVNFAQNFVPSQGVADLAFTNDGVFQITLNGLVIGTMTIPAGQAFGPFAVFSGGPTSANVGDVVRVIGPNPADISGGDIGFTLSATKAFLNSGTPPAPGGTFQQILLALTDAMAFSDSMSTNQGSAVLTENLTDILNNWNDDFNQSLANPALTESLSDTLNNWSDSVVINFPSLLQEHDAIGSSTTFSNAVKNGSAVVLAIGIRTSGATVSSVTDNKGNSYTQVSGVASTYSSGATDIWYSSNVVGGSSFQITVTMSSGSPTFCAYEIAGVSTVDVSGKVDNGTGTTMTGVSLAGTGSNGDFYVEVFSMGSNYSSGAGSWTVHAPGGDFAALNLLSSGTQSVSPVQASSTAWSCSAVAFK